MPLTMITGDLLDSGLPAIGHGCNCSGVMGAGIAKSFARRFPGMFREYRRRCLDGRFRLGGMMVWATPRVVVYNLATQPVPGPSATVEAVDAAVRAALADVHARGLAQLGLPRIGAGIGGLAWEDVHRVLAAAAQDSPVGLVIVSLPAAGRGVL